MKLNKLAIVLFSFSLIANIVLALFLLKSSNLIKPTSANAQMGKIIVTVLEANTLNPIDNATVCIIETRKYYSTNQKGLTENIIVPILPNDNFNQSLKRNWGEMTILVYKSGYADSINFYTAITNNNTRVGFVVYLTPIINEEDNKPNINVEQPNSTWTQELINLYKK